MDKKRCFVCGKTKLPTDFYRNRARHDGLCGKCKECDSNGNRDRTEFYKRWEKTRRLKFPLQVAAKYAVRNAVISGKLKRLPCKKCGKEKAEAHHPDYSKPLNVVWLCKKHHAEIHHPPSPSRSGGEG